VRADGLRDDGNHLYTHVQCMRHLKMAKQPRSAVAAPANVSAFAVSNLRVQRACRDDTIGSAV
jgi:hypothetical protein